MLQYVFYHHFLVFFNFYVTLVSFILYILTQIWPSLHLLHGVTRTDWVANWKQLEVQEKKNPFFLVLNTVLLPQDLVHTESFVEDKFCATISIQNRAMVSTCSTSHTGTVKRRCSAPLRGPAKVLWYRWCISICELVLLCKYAEVRISYFSCKMEEVAADWRNFFQVSCKWNTKVENQNLFSKCMKKY